MIKYPAIRMQQMSHSGGIIIVANTGNPDTGQSLSASVPFIYNLNALAYVKGENSHSQGVF